MDVLRPLDLVRSHVRRGIVCTRNVPPRPPRTQSGLYQDLNRERGIPLLLRARAPDKINLQNNPPLPLSSFPTPRPRANVSAPMHVLRSPTRDPISLLRRLSPGI